jgi:hypothetical protein
MPARKKLTEPAEQIARFREMARQLEADESPHALDRAFARLDTKKKATPQPAKRISKPK